MTLENRIAKLEEWRPEVKFKTAKIVLTWGDDDDGPTGYFIGGAQVSRSEFGRIAGPSFAGDVVMDWGEDGDD